MKEAYYFSHDSNSRNDPKIKAMMSKYGVEGYGRFWIIIEILREQEDYKLPLVDYIIEALSVEFNTTVEEAREYIKDLIEKYHLLKTDNDNKYFWSESLLRRMRKKEEIRQKRVEAVRKRWSSNTNEDSEQGEEIQTDTNEIQMQYISNTKSYKGKESKGKEKKVKESKKEDNNISPNGDMSTNELLTAKKSQQIPVPTEKIIELYRKHCATLPDVKILSETDRKHLRARWREYPDLEFWNKYFQKVSESDFLTGRKTDWKANFHWLIKPSNFSKVLNGVYDNNNDNSHQQEEDEETKYRKEVVKNLFFDFGFANVREIQVNKYCEYLKDLSREEFDKVIKRIRYKERLPRPIELEQIIEEAFPFKNYQRVGV